MWQKSSHFARKKTIFPSRYSSIFKDYWMTKKAFVAALMKRIEEERDCFILISGKTGSGKSSLCGNLNWRCFANIDNPIKKDGSKMFNDEQCFITDPEEFAYKMIKMEGQSLWMDEGRGIANRRKWYSKINGAVAERKNQNRKLFNIYWICMPFEKEFDPVLASHLTLWMWVRRGVAEIYVARGDIKGSDGLNIPSILEREEKWLKENPTRMLVPPTIHPEFIGRMSFPKMPKKYDERYKELVRIKSGVGKVTEEEAKKFGITIEEKPETTVLNAIDKIKSGEIKDKILLWAALDKIKDDEDKKVKLLNFYLKMNNLPTFDKIFNQDKIKKSRMIKLD